jgi:hypothetical protein
MCTKVEMTDLFAKEVAGLGQGTRQTVHCLLSFLLLTAPPPQASGASAEWKEESVGVWEVF